MRTIITSSSNRSSMLMTTNNSSSLHFSSCRRAYQISSRRLLSCIG
jgi:hypothetical protein